MNKALEFSNMVESIEEEDQEALIEALEQYENLTESQKELVPNNIKENSIHKGRVFSSLKEIIRQEAVLPLSY